MKRKLLVLLLLVLTGMSAVAREFPLCLYGVNDPKDLKLIKKAGFSCVQAYSQDPQHLEQLARVAAKRGLQVVFYPNKILGSEYEAKAQNWPVLAWYLVDEPDVARWSRQQVWQAHARAKQAFPRHQTALVIGQGKTAVPYYDFPDVMMMDWYPVPHLALTSFGDNVRYVKEGMARSGRQDHPMWGVVQIFDWKNFKQYRPDNDRVGRFPATREIRFMSYDGILNGATGLFYYTFKHLGRPLPYAAPEYWSRVKTVVKELSCFRHVLEQGTPVPNPVNVAEPLRMQSWSYKGHTYSILLNASEEPQAVPSELLTRSYRLLYGSKERTQIATYDVWILKIKSK